MRGGKRCRRLFDVLRKNDRLRSDFFPECCGEGNHCRFMLFRSDHRSEANGTGEKACGERQGGSGSAKKGQEVHDGLGLLV